MLSAIGNATNLNGNPPKNENGTFGTIFQKEQLFFDFLK
jgi:hypothetical protein